MNAFKYFLLLLLTLISVESIAGCTNNIATQNFNLNFSTITAQRDVAPGTVVAAQSGIYNVNFSCTDSSNTYQEAMNGTSLGNSLYDIGVSGYGVRVSENDSGGGFHHYFPMSFTLGSYSASYMYKVELVRTTDPAVSGTLRSGQIANVSITNQFFIATWNITGGSITTLACSLSSGSLSFPIGNIPATSFGSTVGTTPSNAQVTQTLGLTCNPGANINISLSGQQNPDVANTSVLALSGQGGPGVAKGVGVQILYGGAPLNLNNTVFLQQSGGGLVSLPIVARYYQTQTAVSPGTANATATLNITYQ
ncbi:spore coat protein U domain-containing protein [Enterobacter roggenkampii]|uniref:spore coat protein U domain-containing protein n=1 Tax=Enterobacter roggenkampii TaxID=1812935 RepID=UPI0029764CB8|nr:spore coat protein U domain-containing protein [Enterobacter roggenkampii]HAS0882609.1 fimbrial protein [Enterobacter roggenkampii]